MNQLLIQIVFGWPFIVLSILASIVGILNNRAWIVLLGALMIIPFAYNLNSLPPFGGYALLLPILQTASAFAVFEEKPVWAWVLFTPTVTVILWLIVIDSISGFF
jgi:hypothetical protein